MKFAFSLLLISHFFILQTVVCFAEVHWDWSNVTGLVRSVKNSKCN